MIRIDTDSAAPYPRLVGGTPFADEVNKRSSEYWVNTGNYRELKDIAMDIFVDHYNETHHESGRR